ncbi:MAG: sigma-54-dependent transcriptional regulator, partial [Planctomycetota bacterium]
FEKEGFRSHGVATAAEALACLEEHGQIGIVVTDLRLPGMDGLDLLREVKKLQASTEVVLMTGYGTIKSAVEAMKVGASDYLTKPFEMDALLVVVRRLVRMWSLEGEVQRLRTELKDRYQFHNIVGGAPCMREVFELTRAAAATDSPVLVEGESGTGKELVARAIHYEGLRSRGPFVPVNCSALPTDLVESELFGHRRGAFTGAHRDSQGLFLGADGGTIFLDEITEMPLEAQVKLLRVLEDKRVRPVGAVESIPADVRVVAATNLELAGAVKTGVLREDLFYRLGVIVISVPPLRERTEDIAALAMHFVQQFNERSKSQVEGFSAEALDALRAYSWPGNVRELRNAIEGLYALGRRGRIEIGDLPRAVRDPTGATPRRAHPTAVPTLEEAQRSLVEAALRETRGNKSEAARLLGISRSRLYHFIQLHRIRV